MFIRVAHSARQSHEQLLSNLFDEIVSEEPLAPQNLFCMFCIPLGSFRGRHSCYFTFHHFYILFPTQETNLSVCLNMRVGLLNLNVWYNRIRGYYMNKIVKQYGVSCVQSHSAPGTAWLSVLVSRPWEGMQGLQALARAAEQQGWPALARAGPAGPVEPELALFGPYGTACIQTQLISQT